MGDRKTSTASASFRFPALLRSVDAVVRAQTPAPPPKLSIMLGFAELALKDAARKVATIEAEIAKNPRSEILQKHLDRRLKELRVACVKFSEEESRRERDLRGTSKITSRVTEPNEGGETP